MVCGVFLIACDRVALIPDDLEGAREAAQQRDWLQAERLLERYLRTEERPAQRWEAWTRLLEIRDRINPDPKAELLYLETMLSEFSHDEAKLKVILLRFGALRENLGQTAQALAVWTRLVELAGLTDTEAADIQRRIGNLHFRQRRFDLAEEALQTCRALPVDESVRAWCLYDLALANMARDELADARDQAMQVLSMHVDDQLRGLAGFLLADVLEQQGQRAEALQRFESVRALYPNEMVVDNRIAYLKKRLQQTPGGR
jgi:tetratricopeptide (TPR) repeat protein